MSGTAVAKESKYDLLAIDLDGTFLGRDAGLIDENIDAVRRARAAGLRVVFCTGRGLVEAKFAFDAVGHAGSVVVAGGAIISDPSDGSTLHRFEMDHDLVVEAVDALINAGHPALVLKDPAAAGHDYLVVQGPDELAIDQVTEWWFARAEVVVRYAASIETDEHPEHTVRVGACGRADTMGPITRALEPMLGDRAMLMHFKAVVSAEESGTSADEEIHILEVFDARAHKWGALEWILEREGIAAERVVAIGDEINDVSMLEGAGLGIAMGNSVDSARAAADKVTEANHEAGLARAIDRVLEGEW